MAQGPSEGKARSRGRRPVLVLDFGSQVTQLIARRVRELSVYCEIHPFDLSLDEIREMRPLAIILSGGPASVLEVGAPRVERELLDHCLGRADFEHAGGRRHFFLSLLNADERLSSRTSVSSSISRLSSGYRLGGFNRF